MTPRDRTTYAADTIVPVERSRAEIEQLLKRFGAEQFGYAAGHTHAQVMFRANNRTLRFDLPLSVSANDREKAQRDRAAWRALVLSIKAKVVAVESGIVTFDVEFMPQTVMPDGRTVAQHALPAIEDSYKNRKAQSLLPHFPEA
jgi:hypothetical protein